MRTAVNLSISFVLFLVLAITSNASSLPTLPNNVVEYVPIMIQNTQSVSTGNNFQQMITFSELTYNSHAASNFQNVEFSYSDGTIIPSWLESYGANVIYWLKLKNGISSNSNVIIYMDFLTRTISVFDGITIGESPTLSPQYGEYDNGNAVFNHYTNFEGNTLPKGWSKSYYYSGVGMKYSINNGLTVGGPTYTCSCGHSFISNYNIDNTSFIEEDILIAQTKQSGIILAMYSNSNSVKWLHANAGSLDYQNGAGLALQGVSNTVFASPNPTVPSTIGINHNSIFANYTNVGSLSTGNTFQPGHLGLAFGDFSGRPGSIYFQMQWIRVRTNPPNNIMPSTSFSNQILVHCNTQVKIHVNDILQCAGTNTADLALNAMYAPTSSHGKIANISISCNGNFVISTNVIYTPNIIYSTNGCGSTITTKMTNWDITANFIRMDLSVT